MRAVVKEAPGPGFVLRETDRPLAEPGTVVVRVEAVGICGSDVPIFDGVRDVPYPLILGHEFAGVIAEVGPQVTAWDVEDRVTAGLVIGCGHCPYCRQGREMLCDDLQEIGFHVNGAYAEYVQVPVANLVRLPDEVSFHQGASVDPVASSYHGLRRLNLRPEDAVVLFGDGAIGLYALQAVRARGVDRTLLVGHHDSRLEVAAGFGAAVVNSHHRDPREAISRFTDGRMADVVVEATGAAPVMANALDATGKGGTILLLGVFHHDAQFNPASIVRQELQVTGSFCYSKEAFAASLGLLHRGQVDVDPVVTHVLPMEEIGAALEMIHQREAIKVILEP